uniref:Mab-21-like HhH/H2TH-like domain-containing protein n=1 Tax=Calidris pygmaea TaxID=425635 RepID=A0A8C3KC09_9CHAR
MRCDACHTTGDLDEATREHMRLRAEETTQLPLLQVRSLEQKSQEQSSFVQGALLFASLQHWQFWAVAEVSLLLFGLFWRSGQESDDKGHLIMTIAKDIRWATKSVAYKRRVAEELVSDLLGVFQARLANSFFPVLEPAIGVGSVFEGWSPRGRGVVYCLLVPLKPPRGHTFHLELGSVKGMPAKSHVRVQLDCTCRRDQHVENMLCFVHQPKEALRRNQDSSLISNLCTGFYLDAQKIARWFQTMVSSAWAGMPQWHHYSMKVLPSHRSCKLLLTTASRRSLFVKVIFGVQQGDSDIFLSSQATETIFTLGTTWAESYAVAEAKFFRHITMQAPQDTFHLKCLQLCAGILVGTGFSTYTLKTIVMHLLNTLPPESWGRTEFLLRLQDIMWYLRGSLEEKRLDHFFFANENVPEDIVLPPAFQAAEPLNLFQCLVQDPAAHAKALRELEELQDRLTKLLFYGV